MPSLSFYIQAGWRIHVACQLGTVCTTHTHTSLHLHIKSVGCLEESDGDSRSVKASPLFIHASEEGQNENEGRKQISLIRHY